MIYLVISVLLPQILCQYVADLNMKPDVTFGEQNDRFDLTALTQQQNRYYDRHAYADGENEYRRHNRRNDGGMKIIYSDGRVEDFSYYNPPEKEGLKGTVEDYKNNLKQFLADNGRRTQKLIKRLHEDVKEWRRSNSKPEIPDTAMQSVTLLPPDPEKEVLMHHAVPIEMAIQGYIQMPLVV